MSCGKHPVLEANLSFLCGELPGNYRTHRLHWLMGAIGELGSSGVYSVHFSFSCKGETIYASLEHQNKLSAGPYLG